MATELPIIETERICGPCVVCCEQVTITELDKPANQPCRYQKISEKGSCTIHGTPQQPSVCKSFQCAWIRGCGDKDVKHRPDHNGVMFSVSGTGDQCFGYAMEYREGALLTTARSMLTEFVRAIPYPVIVRSFESKPPYDYGDMVVVKAALYQRSKRRLCGELIMEITPDIRLFTLIHERDTQWQLLA